MNANTKKDTKPVRATPRPRNIVWTMQANARLKMAPEQEVPHQVVVLEDFRDEPIRSSAKDGACRRQIFLLLCLVLTSTLAYLVFSGHVRF